ncbi:hypothetical protein [Pedobacter sp. SYSU D00535]|uniref:hypothetical protein n=1 Tax=Pedobacter sp. SYSU D00535 TaxID=2810308 RepID=UPI001A96E027|nr:hypothetical protein [Pedobacter sp. SYSU D00535]
MVESVTIELIDNELEEFKSEEPAKHFVLEELLKKKLKKIEELLVSYHFRTRGRVFDIRVEPGSVKFKNFNSGEFTAGYRLGIFNACADIDAVDIAKMLISFVLNLDTKTLLLTGEYIPEREPDEF